MKRTGDHLAAMFPDCVVTKRNDHEYDVVDGSVSVHLDLDLLDGLRDDLVAGFVRRAHLRGRRP